MEEEATSSNLKTVSRNTKIDKLREKIRGKLQLSKTRSETLLLQETGESEYDQHLDNEISSKLRSNNDKEDEQDRALQRQLLLRKSRAKEGHSSTSPAKDPLPSSEQAYDFFTLTWDSELLDPGPKSDSTMSSTPLHDEKKSSPNVTQTQRVSEELPTDQSESVSRVGGQIDEGASRLSTLEEQPGASDSQDTERPQPVSNVEPTTDGEKLLVGDILKIDDYWQLIDYVPAIYRPYRERIAKEALQSYIPDSTPVPVSEKLIQAVAPRNLADEGFFVGKPPVVAPRNRYKMERRLVQNGEFHWFGEDGEIVSLPNVIDGNPPRPSTMESSDEPLLKADFVKATSNGHPNRLRPEDPLVTCQLDIDIGHLVFEHHHLFSMEHVLASKLRSLHQEYCNRRSAATCEYLNKKLDVLRSAVASAQESGVEYGYGMDEGGHLSTDHLRRLQMYRNEIRNLRQSLNQEQLIDRKILKNILLTWRNMKNVRQQQGYLNTTLQLHILKTEVDRKRDLKEWTRTIDEEFLEEKEDHQMQYTLETEEYQKRLKRWKRSRSKRVRRKASSLNVEPEEDGEEDTMEATIEGKPEPPVPFVETAIREAIEARALASRRNPGEPILHPELSNLASVTTTEFCPKPEQKRRSDVEKCRFFIRILYNDKSVTKTSAKPANNDFCVAFGEMFSLQISQFPRSIALQVFEVQSAGSTVLLASVFVPLPALNLDGGEVPSRNQEKYEFTAPKVVRWNHAGVGSGVPVSTVNLLDASGENVSVLLTSGILFCGTSWNIDPRLLSDLIKMKENRPPGEPHDLVAALGHRNVLDPANLGEWMHSSMLDPNDPANAALIQHVKDRVTSPSSRNYFRLESLQEEFNFVGGDEFLNSRRFKLIGLREKQIPEFRHWHMIPMHDRDIPDTVFEAYELRLSEKRSPPDLEKDTDSYRRQVTEYLNKVRMQVYKRYQVSRSSCRELSDVVAEEQIPDIGSLGTTLIQLTERRRPLRPVRKERKQVTAQNVSGVPVSILVNVASALNVPVRNVSGSRTSRSAAAARQGGPAAASFFPGIGENQVCPLVEITFQRTTLSTGGSSGPNPCWNQDLQWEFRPPNDDFCLANLQAVKDVIYFNLYDEVVVDILEDSRDRGTHVHHRIERHWLGSLQIPFSTLYLNTRIEGTFQVSCPTFLLGYSRIPKSGPASPTHFGSVPLEKDRTYLTVFITLEPTLPLPEALNEKFDSNESLKLLQWAEAFKAAFLVNFPKRECKTTVVDITGKSVFVTRFLRPLAPPDELFNRPEMEGEEKMRAVAQYVSLIPVILDIAIFPGICDIWTTSVQFLNMLVGDQEEHSILLCNYFLHLGKQAFLLLGFAIPEGPSVYVLTQENLESKIWNPCTGERFDVNDSFCPMQSIGSVIGVDNIWLNVQQSSEPTRMTFNFANKKSWQPFFGPNFGNPGLASIQPEAIEYKKTEGAYVDRLQEKIERMLRNRIMQWRPRHRTSFNRHCGHVLRKILVKMAGEGCRELSEEDVHSELQDIVGVYKMRGFPLCVPYTDMETIAETVFATGVHRVESGDLEFALGVHVEPYPHQVVGVWIYVASLNKQ